VLLRHLHQTARRYVAEYKQSEMATQLSPTS
jgi:hypothetical protein